VAAGTVSPVVLPAGLLEGLDDVLVVRGPWVEPDEVAALTGAPARQVSLRDDAPGGHPDGARADGHPDAVLLVVRDRAELRQVVAACRDLPPSTRVGCVLLDGDRPPLTSGRPSWPRVVSLTAAATPLCFTLAELASPLPAGRLVADLARRTGSAHLMAPGWPVVATEQSSPALWAPGDAGGLVGPPARLADVEGDYPPDLVVVDAGSDAGQPATGRARVEHHVLGTLADELTLTSAMTWAEYDALGPETADRRLAVDGALGLGGLDAQVLNPEGFVRAAEAPTATLTPLEPPWLCRVEAPDGPVTLDTRRGPGERDVSRLRPLRAVQVPWRGAAGPRDYCRTVAALSMAGIPLEADPVPSWARALLHPALVETLEGPVATDPMARELRSIRQRRAALTHHRAAAWRAGAAARTGLQQPRRPLVSILLPTRRPEMLGFALRQVARQRGVDLELVLAAHGHQPDPAPLAELAATSTVPVTTLSVPAGRPFGTLLNDAAQRAHGEVLLKIDDDDWYGPDFVADLLLAREYSGADVVGCPPEFLYVEPLAVTVRRREATERHRPIVAGGTMMVSRHAFDAVGGFRRMRRYVDAGLLRAVSDAGGSVYATHGHGYVLRRGAQGHTWDPGLGYFVSRRRTSAQWRGFRPSPLLEADPLDVPPAARPVSGARP
jgi:glycosyl transferase family 2